MSERDHGEGEALSALRARIDDIDGRLVALLRERQTVVAEVAEHKRAHGLPIYHPAREEDLISRRRAEATASDLDPDMVEDVLRRVMRTSRVAQAGAIGAHAVRPGAVVLIVGGGGEMGRSLGGWLAGAGYTVRVLERDGWDRVDELCSGVDLAVLAVPIDRTPDVARRLGPHLPGDCVLTDITSVKGTPLEAMLAAHEGPVVGLHPMFGPTTRSMDRQIVVVTPGRDEEACRWVLDQLAAFGAVLVERSAREHDEAMEVVQALRHFATFTFGQFLHHRRVDLERTLELSAPIYRLELGMVGRLFAQDPSLYAEIIFATPGRRALLREFLETASANLRMLETGDKAAFVQEFREISGWFGAFAEQAIRESSYLIEKLVERF